MKVKLIFPTEIPGGSDIRQPGVYDLDDAEAKLLVKLGFAVEIKEAAAATDRKGPKKAP